ncbi:MAG TPA: hypothetical protein VEC09_01455 [Actinomycetota bacterium]|jgi:hypothetical protein|nr:hypothetical protein [Actinomycetota bacterium]
MDLDRDGVQLARTPYGGRPETQSIMPSRPHGAHVHAYDPSSYETVPCYFSTCESAATVEAIGTYNAMFGLDETVAMMLCVRHASTIQDVVVLITTD